MPCTYVPGSTTTLLSEPSVVRVKALARPLEAGEESRALPLDPGRAPVELGASKGNECLLPEAEELSLARSSRASCSFHAIAFSSRIRLASLTRRRKSGSVVSVRKVSLRILEYAGDAPRCMRDK